jgi:HEAT repeat protein
LIDVELANFDADTKKLAASALGSCGEPGALWVLSRLLDDVDLNVRVAAIEAIAHVGREAPVPAQALLEASLGGTDTYFTTCVLEAMRELKVAPRWAVLEPLLLEDALIEPVLRVAAYTTQTAAAPHFVAALERVRGRRWVSIVTAFAAWVRSAETAAAAARLALKSCSAETLESLFDLLVTSSNDVRAAALLLLCLHGTPRAHRAALGFVPDDELAADALSALRSCGSAAAPVLLEAIQSNTEQLQVDAVGLLTELLAGEQLPSASISSLRPLAGHGSSRVLRAWLLAASRLGEEADLELAARWVSDDAPRSVRRAAVEAVSSCARRCPAAVRRGAALVSPKSQRAAIVALGMAAGDEPVLGSLGADLRFLKAAASSEFVSVRCAVMSALGHTGGRDAGDLLEFALGDEEPEVRLAAIRALGQLKGSDAVPMGTNILLNFAETTHDPELGVAAFQALAATGESTLDTRLSEIIVHSGGWRAVGAVEALARLPVPIFREGILAATRHRDPSVVLAALSAICSERAKFQSALVDCLAHPERWVRVYAAELLHDADSELAQRALAEALDGERDPIVVDALRRSLAEVDRHGMVRQSIHRLAASPSQEPGR